MLMVLFKLVTVLSSVIAPDTSIVVIFQSFRAFFSSCSVLTVAEEDGVSVRFQAVPFQV